MSLIKKINQYNAGASTELLELKMNALKESPFRFYRGTCHLFAEDFTKLYKYKAKVKTWICGDLHFENFGSYKGDNRQVYFDVNDFDEALLAGPEPEMTRFLTSIIIAAGQMKVAHPKLHKAIYDIMDAYTETIEKRKARMMEVEVARGEFKRFFSQMSTLNREEFIAKRTIKQKGALLIKPDDTRYRPLDEKTKLIIFDSLTQLLQHNPRFSQMVFEDAAIRIAGTGSLGLNRYCVLFFSKKKGKHYMVDIKEARQSSLADNISIKQPKFKNEAERIVHAGYLMQFTPPALAVPLKIMDKWYVVKELQPSDDKMALPQFNNDFNRLCEVAREMAVLMGYAHIRSGGNRGASTTDELVKFVTKKQWQKDVVDLSAVLAQKNEKYYKIFKKE